MVGEGYDIKASGFLVAKELEAFGKARHGPPPSMPPSLPACAATNWRL